MTPKTTRQDHLTSFASSLLIAAAHACPAQHPFSLFQPQPRRILRHLRRPLSLSLCLPSGRLSAMTSEEVEWPAQLARSSSAFLESHAVSPSRRERGRPHPPEIPPRLRVPHLPFSPLCPRVKHFSQRERLSSRQVSLSHSGLAFRSLALCPRSEDAIHVYTKCAPRAMGGGKDGRADDGRRDDGTDVEEGEER